MYTYEVQKLKTLSSEQDLKSYCGLVFGRICWAFLLLVMKHYGKLIYCRSVKEN